MAFGVTTITGDKQIQRQLKHLAERTSKRAMAAGINAAMTPIVKALRVAVNSTDASTELKRAARSSIGKRFQRGGTSRMGKTTATVAKVGFSVGKQSKAKRAKMAAATAGHTRPGVGISATNIHWFVLGTGERATKSHPTGQVEGIFGGLTEQALATSSGAALAAARAKISQTILREAAKRR